MIISDNMIQISVIIPVYCNPKGLDKVLTTLVNQEFNKENYEIIVSDNGSNDNTVDVIKNYSNNYPYLVKYVIEDKIKGSYAARNKAIRIAKGDVLAFTDSDCIPVEKWLFHGYNSLIKNRASMIAGKILFTFKNSTPNIWEHFDAAGKLNQKSYVKNAGFGATANLFVRRSMFVKYGLFLSELKSGGDYEFGKRITQSGEKLLYSEKALIYHPARFRFKSKLAKSNRVAQGQKMLSKMSLLNNDGQLNWRQLLFTRKYPFLPDIKLTIREKFLMVLINNFFRYNNYLRRVHL